MATDNRRDPKIRGVIRRYYGLWWTYSLAGGFLFGVYPIFLHSRGLNQFEINSVLAAYFIVTFLTDVPTGAFADTLGRRRSFVLGAGLRVCAFSIYFFAHRYPVFLIAETIDAFGTTFCNGAIDAWGVDALDAAGYEGVKDRLFSRISQLTSAGFMATSVAGAYIADVNIAYPWLLGAAGYLITGIVAIFLMHGEPHAATKFNLRAAARDLVERVRDGFAAGFATRAVLLLSVAGAVTVAAWAPYWLEWPLLFNQRFGVGVWIVGWIYCGLTAARMLGAEVVVRMAADERTRAGRLGSLVIGSAVMLFAAGLMARWPLISLAMLFGMNLCTGAILPLVQSWFNEQIAAGQRATLLSFSTTFQTFGGSVGLLLNGWIADAAGIPIAWQAGAILSLCAAPVYWALKASAAAPAPVATGAAGD
jgi:MFS family permease